MSKFEKAELHIFGTFGYSEKSEGRVCSFSKLEFLSHLESLKLVSNSYLAKPASVSSRLMELTLSKFRLQWSQISTIGVLPNLEILKLLLVFRRARMGSERFRVPKLNT
ncbi:hypothetical protein HAX54_022028 [Datura stramonium]|uniref:Uncharacterized protein n=1 Tax=Datura stramonium TaxID=4076 RepID=A0ABS8UWK6_DATST|nr:hypothetical protein [Datura stramonium]